MTEQTTEEFKWTPKHSQKSISKLKKKPFRNGNFEPLKAIEDTNVVYHITPMPDTAGHDAHKQFISDMRQLISDLKIEFKYLTGEGNMFALAFKSNYRVIGEKPGYPLPVGKKMTEDFLFVYRLEKDKVKEAWANGTFTISD